MVRNEIYRALGRVPAETSVQGPTAPQREALMAERVVKIPTAEISKEISNFTIGLAKLAVHDRVEDAVLSGTGTLVSVGNVYGLLTAAHVIAALPTQGEVGVILFKDGALQKQVIEMAHAEIDQHSR